MSNVKILQRSEAACPVQVPGKGGLMKTRMRAVKLAEGAVYEDVPDELRDRLVGLGIAEVTEEPGVPLEYLG